MKVNVGKRQWPLCELHRGLCALQKHQWAPMTMLLRLWGVEEFEARNAYEAMKALSICEIECRGAHGRKVKGARVRGLMRECCMMEARKWEQVQRWREVVVDSGMQREEEGARV